MTPIDKHIARLVSPYWAEGDPLRWKWKNGMGISGLLKPGGYPTLPEVGMFNLTWLMMGIENPEEMPWEDAENILKWVVNRLASLKIKTVNREEQFKLMQKHTLPEFKVVMLKHTKTLGELAALKTLPEFASTLSDAEEFPERKDIIKACIHKLDNESRAA